jgi:alpha-beta hydrolase superfamily lysophospholipase
MTDAKNYLQGTAGAKAGKVLVYGGSMGALTALVWAMNNPTLVLGVGGIIPVVNLADVHDNNRGGHAASIETAYGGAAGYAAAVAAHNPAANPGLLASMPIKLWTGGNDAVATPGAASAFVAAVGSNASVTSLGAGVDHATGNAAFDPQQIVKFFNSLDG